MQVSILFYDNMYPMCTSTHEPIRNIIRWVFNIHYSFIYKQTKKTATDIFEYRYARRWLNKVLLFVLIIEARGQRSVFI